MAAKTLTRTKAIDVLIKHVLALHEPIFRARPVAEIKRIADRDYTTVARAIETIRETEEG
jgi:hypothetical protein